MTANKVFFWKSGDNDGCSFYRCDEPARVLTETNPNRWQAESTRDLMDYRFRTADVVVGQRVCENGPTELWKRLDQGYYGGHRPKLVYEWDDNLLEVPRHQPGAYAAYSEPHRRQNIIENLRRADVITTPSERLAELSEKWNPDADVFVVPNFVSKKYVIDPAERAAALGAKEDKRIVIGWGGSWSHVVDFEPLFVPLRRALRAYPKLRVHIIGPDYAERLRTAAVDGQLTHTKWIRSVPDYLSQIDDFTIGIAPLADDEFNRSKSDIKVREYAARGICPVASPVGPYCYTDVPIMRARSEEINPSNWSRVFHNLLEYPELVGTYAGQAHEWAMRNTLENHIGLWEKALS